MNHSVIFTVIHILSNIQPEDDSKELLNDDMKEVETEDVSL